MTPDEIAHLRKLLAHERENPAPHRAWMRSRDDLDRAMNAAAPALLNAAERTAALEAALREALTNTVTRTSKELGPEGSTLCEHPKCSAWARPGETLPHDASCPLANGTSALDSALAAARREGFAAGVERAAAAMQAEADEARKTLAMLKERDLVPVRGFTGNPVVRESEAARRMRRVVAEADDRAAAIRALKKAEEEK